MIVKYRAVFGEVQKVEVERETQSFVVFKDGRKDSKNLGWRAYFDTESEAIDHLIETKRSTLLERRVALSKAEKNVKVAESELSSMLEKYGRSDEGDAQ